mgnify:FL=1
MPHMNDPIFEKSLIYMCEHNNEGSMGLIINKPMISENAAEIIKQTGLDHLNPLPDVYFGGPVNLEVGLFLHGEEYNTEGTIKVSKSVSLTTNKQIVADLKIGKGPQDYCFSFGYAGWIEGQLEREIENGDWLLMPANDNFIFSTPNSDKWKKAASQFGIDVLDLGGAAGLA